MYLPPPPSATSSASPASVLTNFDLWSPTPKDSPLTPLDQPYPFSSNDSVLSKPLETSDDAFNSPAIPDEVGLGDTPYNLAVVKSALPEQNASSSSRPSPRPPRLVIDTAFQSRPGLPSNSNPGDTLRSPLAISTTSRNFPTPEEIEELQPVSSLPFPTGYELKSPKSPVEKFKNLFRWGPPKNISPQTPRTSDGSRLGNSTRRRDSRARNNSHEEIPGSPSRSSSPGTHILRYPDSVPGGRLEYDY